MTMLYRALLVIVFGVLVSCGGGGGSSGGSNPPPPPAAPVISTQPASSTVAVGAAVNLQVVATGTGTLSYAWRLNGVPIAGATAATYSIASVVGGDAGTYDCVVTNTVGASTALTTSAGATLSVALPPTITSQPAAGTIAAGSAASLTVAATGNGTLSYAWRLNGVPINGATATTYAIASAAAGNSGTYDVVVTNTLTGLSASTTSTAAILVVVGVPADMDITAEAAVLIGSAGNVAVVPLQGGATFTWSAINATITSGQGTRQITYTAGQLGDARLLVTGTNIAGSALGLKNLRVVAAIPVASIFAPPVVHPSDFDIRGSASGVPGYTYMWTASSGTASALLDAGSDLAPVPSYFVGPTAGSYSLSVTVRDAANNPASLIRTLQVASNVFLKDKRDPAPRTLHTATVMNDGRVLVVGGDAGVADFNLVQTPGTNSRILGTTEIYDPATERWADAGTIGARLGHTGTLLNDGRVLVVGGTAPNGSFLASGSLYDPATHTWSPSGSLIAPRTMHSSTLLANGRVLVTGGADGSGTVATAEIYDPVVNAWAATGALQNARAEHSATLMADGRVLVVGGINAGLVSSVEIFDPSTGTWSAGAARNPGSRKQGAVLLPSGRVLALGTPLGLYDPVADSWSSIRDSLQSPLSANGTTATLLADGTVLASGGAVYSEEVVRRIDVESKTVVAAAGNTLFAGAGSSSTQLNDGNVLILGGTVGNSGAAIASMFLSSGTANVYVANGDYTSGRGSFAHRGAFAVSGTLLDGRVLFAGGETSRIPTFQSATANVDLFNPTTNGWVDLAPMSTSRSLAAAATLLNGRVLVTGGTDGRDGVRASAEYYDQPTNGWHGAGALSSPRYGHTLIALADGSAIAVGGNNVTDCNCTRFQSTVDRYDPVANNWVAANPLAIARERHTATLLPNGKVLVTGGYGGAPNTLADTGASLASAELFDPATGNWTTTGSMNTPRRNHIAILLSGGRVLVAGGTNGATILASAEIYDPATGLWTPAASMHAARDVASVAMLANGNVLVVNGLNGASSAAFGTGTCEVYDPVADSWSATVPTAVPRTGGLATALPDGRVMVVGGWPNYAGAPEFYR